MNFFSIRTNDQNTIGKVLDNKTKIVFDTLSWHKSEISVGDIIYIVISGDSSKKLYDYENGLKAIGKVVSLPKDETDKKHFTLEVEIFEFLPKTFTKDDFYVFPTLKDAPNIGPDTKSAPNQAFRKIDSETGKSIIRALFDLLNEKLYKSTYDNIVDSNYEILKLHLNSKSEEDIKKEFYKFLQSKGRIETTTKQYISKLTEVGKWLIENKVVEKNYNIWLNSNLILEIDSKLNNELKELWTLTNKPLKNWFSSPWNAWKSFNTDIKASLKIEEEFEFILEEFIKSIKNSGLIFSPQLIQRFVASLWTKPFVICSGLSGSGKTKLAQAFVLWISESEKQYKIIPVGADWTNREPLLGYPNGLESKSYVMPDSGALQLILDASKDSTKPYFLILDEMNLSHVERYFADFLSIMESGEKLKLYFGQKRYSKYEDGIAPNENDFIPQEIKWPKNLFIIGTVNIDETTYMFSPKVLDRANVIEFRISPDEMKKFILNEKIELNLDKLFLEQKKDNGGAGQSMGESFLAEAQRKTISKIAVIEGEEYVLNNFFTELQKVGSEFGYRSATEIELLITKLGNEGFLDEKGQPLNDNTKIDIAIMQKLLPKLHGSRNKLTKVLPILGGFCLIDNSKIKEDYFDEFVSNNLSEEELRVDKNIKFKISFEKICRMYKNAVENGFASYAEA